LETLIVGDVHNEFGVLNALITRKKPDRLIACGDFGYWPNVNSTKKLSEIKLQSTKEIRWCDGNHEDHWALRDRTTDELESGIIYMPRGSVYTLEDGRNVMFMGGADSIDKYMRKVGYNWFPEEIITQSDLNDLPDVEIDIMITHTCPSELVSQLLLQYPEKGYEPSNYALSVLWNHYKPSLWFFGHWHQYKSMKVDGTQFYCLSAPGFGDRWYMWLPEKGGD
jgi:Icc-related predicted phosphoesterase